jgi:prenyltransferase beta subunit
MKRIFPCLFSLVVILYIVTITLADSLSREQREATFRYINSLQNVDGGFRSDAAPGPSLVSATSSALRAFKNLGGPTNDKPEKFVLQCLQESGGFSETPVGTPDIRTTWMGVNAIVNMKGAPPSNVEKIREFVTNNAKGIFPNIFFAAATMEDVKIKTPKASEWIAAVEATRNPDGTYGKNASDTAQAVVTILRLGGAMMDPAPIAKTLKAAQSPDGSFSARGGVSDLPGTYTIMRALWMLKEKPNLAGVVEYVRRCRNADGGYGASPGKPSNMAFTYMASSVLHWADELAK